MVASRTPLPADPLRSLEREALKVKKLQKEGFHLTRGHRI